MQDEQKYQNIRENPDQLEEYRTQGAEHPTPEQLLFRIAVDRILLPDQKIVWELYNYDRLTTVEIGKKLKISQQAVSARIKTMEKQLTNWIKDHQEVYEALKQAEYDVNEGC